MRVAAGAGTVDATRRERAAPDARGRVDRLTASYVRARRAVYAGAAASVPFGLNWGSQKRLMFGSLPTITSLTDGSCCLRLVT